MADGACQARTFTAMVYFSSLVLSCRNCLRRMYSDDVLLFCDVQPQLIFRRDAVERFNVDMRYGRRSKVEMLWRLGIPGPWDTWYASVYTLCLR